MRVLHDLGTSITVATEEVDLLHYDYRCNLPAEESPRPFIHPLRSLAGDVVTGFRPTDHPWHRGLSMTMAVLSEGNFWGGPSYVHPDGYRMKSNHGTIIHNETPIAFRRADSSGFSGDVGWTGPDGRPWIREERRVTVSAVARSESSYDIVFESALVNVRESPLELGSPTTEGRPSAGYGGLFWRGPRSFTGGKAFTAEREGDDEAMGSRSAWLAFVGRHDGSNNYTTLVFVDSVRNPRHPTQWFVRSEPIPAVSFAFMFDTVLELPPGERLDLAYRITVANGELTKDQAAEIAGRPW